MGAVAFCAADELPQIVVVEVSVVYVVLAGANVIGRDNPDEAPRVIVMVLFEYTVVVELFPVAVMVGSRTAEALAVSTTVVAMLVIVTVE